MHPQIEFPKKEAHVFDQDSRLAPDHLPIEGYDAPRQRFYFDHTVSHQIAPVCLYWRDCLARLHAYNLGKKGCRAAQKSDDARYRQSPNADHLAEVASDVCPFPARNSGVRVRAELGLL
jgi:hypothetical protein